MYTYLSEGTHSRTLPQTLQQSSKRLISYSKGIDSSDLISDLKLIQKYFK